MVALLLIMGKKIYEIDGQKFSTLEEFAKEFTQKLNLEISWNGNLDALNDILYGGFGTPDEGFILVWRNSELSRKTLGHGETLKWLKEGIQNCHPLNISHFEKRIQEAERQEGETLFDMIVEIFNEDEHNDIELKLS